jgi:hypothetical protein
MAVRGVYTEAEKRMLENTKKDPYYKAGWFPAPTEMVVTEESMVLMALPVDPWNPIWRDHKYARGTRWGDIIALPFYLERWAYSYFGLAITPEVGYTTGAWIGEKWEFFQPVHVNDSFKVWRNMPVIEDFTSLDGKGPRRFKVIPHDVQFINQKDELVNTWKVYFEHAFYPEPPEGRIRPVEAAYKYTKEELDYIASLEKGEEIRGANIRYWEDVKVGEELKPVVMGPITFTDMVFDYQGRRKILFLPSRELRKQPPWKLIVDPDSGVIVDSLEHHFSDRAAQAEGGPGRLAFVFGNLQKQIVARLITNWMGDDGFMTRFDWRHPHSPPVHDTLIGRGKVTNKRVVNGEQLVDISAWLEDLRGYLSVLASVSVRLLSRETPQTWK